MPGKRSNGEGTLRKRSNGLWECTMMVGYKDDGTRRYKSFYGKSQKEAKEKADAYKQEVAAGLYIDPKRSKSRVLADDIENLLCSRKFWYIPEQLRKTQ